MTPPGFLVERGIMLVLTAGIFLLDLFTPPSVAVWVLYLIPLLLAQQSPRERSPLGVAALVSALILFGLAVERPGMELGHEAFNRTMGIGVVWGAAGLLLSRRRAKEKVALATAGREKAEHGLQLNALWLEGIVASAMDGIITVNEAQNIVLFNRAAEQMFQCPAEDALGAPLDRFIPERFRHAHRGHVQAFGHSGFTNRRMGQLGTVMGLRADGQEFPLEAAISHITVEGTTFYTVILRDITERRRAERLLQQSEERYRRLISLSPYAMLVNRGNRVIFANERALTLFGAVKAEEILGKSPFELFHPDYHPVIRERIQQLLEGSQAVQMVEEKIVSLDGTTIDVEVSAAQFTDEEGPAILVMLRDISERKRLQEQLCRTERIAELGTLASGMAHEIGTPMNVILGRAEYLMERTSDETLKKGLQTIVSQVERITRVMNQLLAFARRRSVNRLPVDLRKVLADCLEIFHERLHRHHITVDIQAADDLPLVEADADQLSQVLLNLIINAIHAMPSGGGLGFALRRFGQTVRVSVSDTGHGIAAEDMAKIFDPFFTTKEVGKGTGLGLTVVKGIVKEHGGDIAVESQPGQGTTFVVTLPIRGKG